MIAKNRSALVDLNLDLKSHMQPSNTYNVFSFSLIHSLNHQLLFNKARERVQRRSYSSLFWLLTCRWMGTFLTGVLWLLILKMFPLFIPIDKSNTTEFNYLAKNRTSRSIHTKSLLQIKLKTTQECLMSRKCRLDSESHKPTLLL